IPPGPLAAPVPRPESPPPETPPMALPVPWPEPAPSAPADDRPAEAFVDEARSRADFGDLEGARLSCRTGLARYPLDPMLHFSDGLTADAAGLPDEAEAAFRRSIYLNRNFVMSYYCLGILLLGSGRTRDGRRALANAAQLAATMPPEAEIPEGQGLVAADVDAI